MSLAGLPEKSLQLPNETDFARALGEVMQRLRSAFADLIAGVPGGIRRAADLGKVLGIDAKTSWRVFKIATAVDPLEVSSHVPSRVSMRRVVREASKLGAPAGVVGAVEEALEEFDGLVERFAGDRATFDSMASVFGEESSHVDQMHLRAAFRANAHILGVTARVQYGCSIFQRSATEQTLMDVASVRGHYDLQRLRRGAHISVSRLTFKHDTGAPGGSRPQPLDPSAQDETGYLRDFCGEPPAPLRVVHASEGEMRVEVADEVVGLPSSGTYLFGNVIRGVMTAHRTEDDTRLLVRNAVRMPTELLVYDMFLHDGLFGRVDPITYLLSDIGRDEHIIAPERCGSVRLPTPVGADYLGRGLGRARSLDMPRHVELLGWAFGRLGCKPEDFHLYRCRVEYPVLPSSLVFEFELPEV